MLRKAISIALFITAVLLGYILVAFVIFSLRVDSAMLATMSPEVASGFVHRMSLPVWLYAHRVAGLLYPLLGLVQFLPALRRRFPRIHRVVGRLFVFHT